MTGPYLPFEQNVRCLMHALADEREIDHVLRLQEIQDSQGNGRLVAQHPL